MKALAIALLFLACTAACAVWRSPAQFRVVPGNSAYRLRWPRSREEVPFAEILRRYNGFEAGRDSIDLRPLMELRIENAYYQPGASRRGLSGFLGTEVARYRVGAGGLELVSAQPMGDRPAGQAAVQDLIRPSQAGYRCYRFFYEILFRNTGDSRGSVLLGASAESELDRIAGRLLENPDAVCVAGSANCTVFPEACSVSIEMQIVVNGRPQSVLWGTRLASVVSRPGGIQMWRLEGTRLMPVRLNGRDARALQLPLLPGDRVRWAGR